MSDYRTFTFLLLTIEVLIQYASMTTHAKPVKTGRKLMSLPLPTHKLVSRVAALRGVAMSDVVYAVFRDELRRQESGDAWALAPEPFSIKPTYEDGECLVLVWNPLLPTLKLNRREASDIAVAIHSAVEGTPIGPKVMTAIGGHRVAVTRGGQHISLCVDYERFSMVRPVAADVADALISASVHAGPIPAGKPI